MYSADKHGISDYNSMVEIDPLSYSDFTSGSLPLSGQKFAKLVQPIETVYGSIIKVSGDITWVMKTKLGNSVTSGDPYWQIQRITNEDSNTTIIEWADGNAFFDNIASDYETLVYSF